MEEDYLFTFRPIKSKPIAYSNNTSASLYVGDLLPKVTEQILHNHFSQCGPVHSVRICRDSGSGKSLRYGYVNYKDAKDADRALKELNFSKILGIRCRVMREVADNGVQRSTGNIFVRNLDGSIDSKDLFDIFSEYGSVISCKVLFGDNGQSLRRGYVQFASDKEAQKAIELTNQKKVGKCILKVTKYMTRQQRQQLFNPNSELCLFVRGIPKECSDDKVEALFKVYGQLSTTYIPSRTGNCDKIGWGYINYCSPLDAAVARTFLNDTRNEELQLSVVKPWANMANENDGPNSGYDNLVCVRGLPVQLSRHIKVCAQAIQDLTGLAVKVQKVFFRNGRPLGQALIDAGDHANMVTHMINCLRPQRLQATILGESWSRMPSLGVPIPQMSMIPRPIPFRNMPGQPMPSGQQMVSMVPGRPIRSIGPGPIGPGHVGLPIPMPMPLWPYRSARVN
uniref:ARAD1B07238p n=1 Tax=Blastobotrys adeninivorans TaxID=409370 RepID=A0A060TBF9_BLAAD